MDFCFHCGHKTDPDWVFCRACGSALEDDADLAVPVQNAGTPKVELISRGWDEEIVETIEVSDDPLTDEEVTPAPVPPGGIEIKVDDITVIEATDADPAPDPVEPPDPWNHLRPRGELPPLRHHVTRPGRVGQALALLAALGALSAAAIHFYLNTQLNAFSDGTATARTIDDLRAIADMSLIVAASLVLVAAGGLSWWAYRSLPGAYFRRGQGGTVAFGALVAGVGLVGWSLLVDADSLTRAIGTNSLIVLGLGLVMAACLAAVRAVDRIDRREPA